KDPAKLVEIETKITQNIYQKGVKGKVADLTSRVNQVLKSKSNQKSQIAALKKELLEFISSSNVYYSAHQKEIKSLLTKLESLESSENQQTNSPITKPNNFPLKMLIPLLLIGILLLMII
ncbi:4237_t:CDS:1, partial [Funneliformis geosporum]